MSRYEKFDFYYKNFIKKKIDDKIIKELDEKFSNYVFDKIVSAKEIKGCEKFLISKSKTASLYINSATPHSEIIKIVKKRNLHSLFKSTYGSPSSKIDNIYKIIKKEKLPIEKFIFFGDAMSDYKAANYHDMDFVFINSGNYGSDFLKKFQFSIDNFKKLVS